MLFEFSHLQITGFNDIEYKVIDYIEKRFRSSKEYRLWITYLRDMQLLRYTPEYNEIDFVDNKLTLEIHHIITLYDIVEIILHDMVSDLNVGEYVLPIDVIKRLEEIHLNDEVLTVPLSKTFHELLHKGFKSLDDIDNDLIHIGNVDAFIKRYRPFLSDKHVETYRRYLTVGELDE